MGGGLLSFPHLAMAINATNNLPLAGVDIQVERRNHDGKDRAESGDGTGSRSNSKEQELCNPRGSSEAPEPGCSYVVRTLDNKNGDMMDGGMRWRRDGSLDGSFDGSLSLGRRATTEEVVQTVGLVRGREGTGQRETCLRHAGHDGQTR